MINPFKINSFIDKMQKIFILLCLFIIQLSAFCQLDDQSTKLMLKKHISYLADDKLEGRETGSKGERLAYEYIIQAFENIGIEPKGTQGFLQEFNFHGSLEIDNSTNLVLDNHSLKLYEDYIPVPNSKNGVFEGKVLNVGYGIDAPVLKYNDYPKPNKVKDKIVLIKLGHPEQDNPHSAFQAHSSIRLKINKAVELGAKAVFLTGHKDLIHEHLHQNKMVQNVTISKIPVMYIQEHVWDKIKVPKKIKASIQQTRPTKTGYNVLGYIDNNSKNTVVIGGHYDHLGFGEFGSLYTGTRAIHNGADDNASGIALIIELARQLKKSKNQKNNYLFACFSGEEMGLYGSNSFIKNPSIEIKSMNYMLNFDMVGRLDKEEAALAVNGFGSSPQWATLDSINVNNIQYKKGDSGIGPSDHTPFYLKDVPVLHFFSGAHSDYHKPSDDEEKINYEGLLNIQQIVSTLINNLNDFGKLAFTKTKETSQSSPKFSVGLGIIPDYLFDKEKGVRIDGVVDGKVAAKAKLKEGDIIIKLGNTDVTDLQSYMFGLSQYKKGDSAEVIVKRGQELIKKEITFF